MEMIQVLLAVVTTQLCLFAQTQIMHLKWVDYIPPKLDFRKKVTGPLSLSALVLRAVSGEGGVTSCGGSPHLFAGYSGAGAAERGAAGWGAACGGGGAAERGAGCGGAGCGGARCGVRRGGVRGAGGSILETASLMAG